MLQFFCIYDFIIAKFVAYCILFNHTYLTYICMQCIWHMNGGQMNEQQMDGHTFQIVEHLGINHLHNINQMRWTLNVPFIQ